MTTTALEKFSSCPDYPSFLSLLDSLEGENLKKEYPHISRGFGLTRALVEDMEKKGRYPNGFVAEEQPHKKRKVEVHPNLTQRASFFFDLDLFVIQGKERVRTSKIFHFLQKVLAKNISLGVTMFPCFLVHSPGMENDDKIVSALLKSLSGPQAQSLRFVTNEDFFVGAGRPSQPYLFFTPSFAYLRVGKPVVLVPPSAYSNMVDPQVQANIEAPLSFFFDFDGVVGAIEEPGQTYFEDRDLEAYWAKEEKMQKTPFVPGPLFPLFNFLVRLGRVTPEVTTGIVTARSNSAASRFEAIMAATYGEDLPPYQTATGVKSTYFNQRGGHFDSHFEGKADIFFEDAYKNMKEMSLNAPMVITCMVKSCVSHRPNESL